jgi:hypothetical protein
MAVGRLVRRPRLMLGRIARELDEGSAKILLGSKRVVSAAAEREVLLTVLSTLSERPRVVQLDSIPLTATLPRVARIRAAPFVAREHGAPDRGRDVSSAPARVPASSIRRGFGRRGFGLLGLGRSHGLGFKRLLGLGSRFAFAIEFA